MIAPNAPAALEACARLDWRGAVVTVTVRADDPALLARRLDRALAALRADAGASRLEHAAPTMRASAPALAASAARMAPASAPVAAPPPAPVCASHGAPLTWRTPKGGGAGWWSHRTPDGGWCRG